MVHNISSHNRPVEQTPGSHRQKRRAVNCEECQRSKLRCDRQHPCGACKCRRCEASCSYGIPSGAPVSIKTHRTPITAPVSTAPSSGVGFPSTPLRQNFANASVLHPEAPISKANQAPLGTNWEIVLQRPAPEHDAHDSLTPLSISPRISLHWTIDSLSPKSCCDYLISRFFKHISALFPTLHGPTFQKQFTAFIRAQRDDEWGLEALEEAIRTGEG